jgi:uncharacterized membrane protein
MESRAKALGHPLHPLLIVFPLGLLSTAVIVDVLYLVTGNPRFPFVAFVLILGGLLGGLVAAVFGLRDYLAIPGSTRAKSVGLYHGIGNLVVMGLFVMSLFLRWSNPDYVPTTLAFILGVAGLALAGLTGWLGAELIYRLGVGVDRGANLNASNSLSGEPARGEGQREAEAPSSAR